MTVRVFLATLTTIFAFASGAAARSQTPAPVVPGGEIILPALPAAVPEADRLTLAQATELAMKISPQIKASGYQLVGAQANYSGQRVPLNPVFNVGGLNNSVAPWDFGNLANYGITFTVETSGKLQWRSSAAHNQLLAARADSRTTQYGVREAVTAAYVTLQVADRGLQDEREAYDTAVKLRDLTQRQFAAGAVPQTNAIRAQIALTQEAGNLFQAINAVNGARASLNVQIGRGADLPIDATEPLAYNPIHPGLDALQADAARTRPELVSAEYTRKALAANVGLQRSQYYPDLLFGTDLHAIGQGRVDVGLALPLFDFGSIRGAVKQAQMNVKAQEEQIDQLRKSVQLDVASAYQSLMLAEQTVDVYATGIVPQSESLLQRTERGYTLGASSILDLIDAQSTLRAARIAYYGAIGNYRQALAQLEHAVGAPITAINGAPAPTALNPGK